MKAYDRSINYRSSMRDRWAEHDERSRQRAMDRQAWSDQVRLRREQRLQEFRERVQQERVESIRRVSEVMEEANMVRKMVDALCMLDSSASKERKRQPEENRPKREQVKKSRVRRRDVDQGRHTFRQ